MPDPIDKMIINICKLLRDTRESEGITQTELAKRVGKCRNVISKIESEGCNITLKTLFNYVEYGLNKSIYITIKDKKPD